MTAVGSHIPRGARIREARPTAFDVMAARAAWLLEIEDRRAALEAGVPFRGAWEDQDGHIWLAGPAVTQ